MSLSILLCRDNKGGLTLHEIWEMTEGHRLIFDPTGWTAEKMEWLVSYYLFADDDVSNPPAFAVSQMNAVCCIEHGLALLFPAG